jgi:hypothetical protein
MRCGRPCICTLYYRELQLQKYMVLHLQLLYIYYMGYRLIAQEQLATSLVQNLPINISELSDRLLTICCNFQGLPSFCHE